MVAPGLLRGASRIRHCVAGKRSGHGIHRVAPTRRSVQLSEAQKIMSMRNDIGRRIGDKKPTMVLVLGSGLGGLAKKIKNPIFIDYKDIPHFPKPEIAVPGHEGRFVIGELNGVTVIAMQGRVHLYQGLTPEEVVRPIRALLMLGGIENVIITNAAGGMYKEAKEGDIVLITDHINNTGEHFTPFMGMEKLGPLFFDMSDAYSKALHPLIRRVAKEQGTPLEEGVYVGNHGPEYETPAEIKMLAAAVYKIFDGWLFWIFFKVLHWLFNEPLGKAVGMSTVPEVMAINQYNARLKEENIHILDEGKKHKILGVIGLSYITNPAAGIIPDNTLSHSDVNKAAGDEDNSSRFIRLVTGIIQELKAAA